MIDVKACLQEAEEMMQMSIMHLEDEYSHIRAGKANVHILDCVRVHSYGSEMPLNNVATVTTPDLRTIAIKPWDKFMRALLYKVLAAFAGEWRNGYDYNLSVVGRHNTHG